MTTGALQLEIAGERIETWASYRVSSSMLTPADDWSASLFVRGDAQARALLASYVRVGEPVKAYIVQNHGQPDELRALARRRPLRAGGEDPAHMDSIPGGRDPR